MATKIWSSESFIALSKLIIGVIVGALTLAVAYFTVEMSQNERITKVTTSLDNHIKQSKETFKDLDVTMHEQRISNERTSNALTRIVIIQEALKEEDSRICKKLDDLEKRVKGD